MLEKIGLPAKPSLRGNNWVVDASHCQGCSSQFSFINRKHHCRRCGGLFCGSCTQQRMALRGQGDAPVRICEPCKKLEEAARFEMRHGNKNRAGRGLSKSMLKSEDEVLNQILGNDGHESFSSTRSSTMDMVSNLQRGTSSASCSNIQEEDTTHDGDRDILRSNSVDTRNHTVSDLGSSSPEELLQQATEEKRKYKILKREGKSEEAMKAFKRGKELERQAGALEISLRKSRKKALSTITMAEIQTGIKSRVPLQTKDKDDLFSELRELGWSDMDLHDADKKPVSTSLEGELSSLVGETGQKSTRAIDKTQVLAHKKRALLLKREGNLTEAKEELKKAKILEKQLEEQEFLVEDEESDDELAALIRSIDADKEESFSIGYEPNLNFDIGNLDDIGNDSILEVTEDDIDDPEIASALKLMGWNEDSHQSEENATSAPIDRESLSSEILSLKKEALSKKRAGNAAEAMSLLKQAKVLERELENIPESSVQQNDDSKLQPKNKSTIQKELLSLKKKALALRREGRVDEAEEELKKGKLLEQQLDEMNNESRDISGTIARVDEVEEDVTDQDMADPTYLSLLKNLGWNDEENESRVRNDSPTGKIGDSSVTGVSVRVPKRRSKGEIQRELLGLKRKALAFRRKGEDDEAEEVLRMAKVLEAEMEDVGPLTKVVDPTTKPLLKDDKEEEDGRDPELHSMLGNLGWKEENVEPVEAPVVVQRSKGEIQRELLGLKRKALALRRQGEVEEAEEVLSKAKALEAQIEESEAPSKESLSETESLGLTIQPENDQTNPSSRNPTNPVPEASQLIDVGNLIISKPSANINEPKSSQTSVETKDFGNQTSTQQEILAYKRKAVALKRDGKIAEAREQLRHAKLLEKKLEAENTQLHTPSNIDVSVSTSKVPSFGQKEKSPPNSGSKPLISGRDRFKLQQESLGHKRQALKLRREGRTEEAEAEFELAKALESQLEESDSKDSEPIDDVGVEDFLDPQLLSALREIGVDDTNVSKRVPEPPVSGSIQSSSQERTQLEEQVKAEKVKAVTLKRSGKQAEALDALRRAKLLEKKLNSLAS